VTVKDTEGAVDIKILLDKEANPLGYYGYIDGGVVKDASGNLAPLEKASRQGRQNTGYGV